MAIKEPLLIIQVMEVGNRSEIYGNIFKRLSVSAYVLFCFSSQLVVLD